MIEIVIRYISEDSIAQSIKWKKENRCLARVLTLEFRACKISEIWKWRYDASNNLVDESEIDEMIKQMTTPYQGHNKSNNSNALIDISYVPLILHAIASNRMRLSLKSIFFLEKDYFYTSRFNYMNTLWCAIYQIKKSSLEIFTFFPPF